MYSDKKCIQNQPVVSEISRFINSIGSLSNGIIINFILTTYNFFHKRAHSLKTQAISRTKGSSFSSAMAVAPEPFTVQGLMETTHAGNMPQVDLFFELKPLYQTEKFYRYMSHLILEG